ncbi:unnamed protein product [Brassica rapa subsp. narinosa]
MVEDRTYLLARVFSSSRLSESKWLYMHPSEEQEDSSASILRNGGKRAFDDDDDKLRQSKSLKLTRLSIHGNASDQQQHGDGDSLINDIGRDNSISCLLRCSRSDYSSIASLNRSFRSLVKSGDIYRLRRQNMIVEHWVYFSCQLLEWVAFDPVERRWMNLPTMPSGVTFMCADKESLAVGTDLLVLGKDDDSSHVVYRYSLLTNSWSPGERMNSPRCLFGSASLGEIAIFAGGCDSLGKISDVAEMYNSELQTWTTLPKMNKPRKMCSGVFMDGKFYVIGGVVGGGEEYDLATKTGLRFRRCRLRGAGRRRRQQKRRLLSRL